MFRVNRILEQNLSKLVEKWHYSHYSNEDLFIKILANTIGVEANHTILAMFEGMFLGGHDDFLSKL